jgi:hypothetical protein
VPDVTLDTGDFEAWARCHSLAVACRQIAVRVADGDAAHELETVARALDVLDTQIVEVGHLLPAEDPDPSP